VGCEKVIVPEVYTEDEGSIPVELPNGMVRVTIPNPATSAKSSAPSRALSGEVTEMFMDYTEVIFREHGTTTYYSGKADEGKTLTVDVVPNKYYDILLLAGKKDGRVLLASSFGNKAALGVVSFDNTAAAEGIPIRKGAVTALKMTLVPIEIDPETDYTAVDTDVGSFAIARGGAGEYKDIAMTTIPTKTDLGSADVTVAVTVKGAKPLVDAVTTPGALAAIDGTFGTFLITDLVQTLMRLGPYSSLARDAAVKVVNVTGTVNGNGSQAVLTTVAADDTTLVSTFTFDNDDWPDPAFDPLLNKTGAYAALRFNMKYAPYNDTNAGSSWNIRPGLLYGLDTAGNSSTSELLVVIGEDLGNFLGTESVSVDFE
jgi:hypothetical protein